MTNLFSGSLLKLKFYSIFVKIEASKALVANKLLLLADLSDLADVYLSESICEVM